jgi:hypothetical protein
MPIMAFSTLQKKSVEQKLEIVQKRHNTIIKRYGKYSFGGRKPGFKQTQKHIELMRNRMSGGKHPFCGGVHTEETKQKMSDNHADVSGENNPFKKKYDSSEEFRNAFKLKHKQLWKSRDEEWKRKFKEKQSLRMMGENKIRSPNGYEQGHWLSDKCIYGGYLRSSWEIFFASLLDLSNLIKEYKIENYIVEYYNSEGVKRHTKLDFEVTFTNEQLLLVEIKSIGLLTFNIDKIEAVEGHCIENSLQFIILSNDCFFKEERILSLLERAYKGDLYVEEMFKRSIKSGINGPVCISTKM